MTSEEPDPKTGYQVFTDGVAREVFEHGDQSQYGLDDADQRIHGRWLPPADELHIV
jgi:hypothetical protein